MRVEIACDELGHVTAHEADGLADLGRPVASMFEVDDAWWRSYRAARDVMASYDEQLRAMLDVRWHGAASLRARANVVAIGKQARPGLRYTHPRVLSNRS